MQKRLALVTRGVMDIKPGRPLFVTLANFQESPVHILKVMNVTLEEEEYTAKWDLNNRRRSSYIGQTTDPFEIGVFYAEGTPSTSKARSWLEVQDALLRSAQEDYTDTTLLTDCGSIVQVGDKYCQYKNRIVQLFTP